MKMKECGMYETERYPIQVGPKEATVTVPYRTLLPARVTGAELTFLLLNLCSEKYQQ